MSGAVYGARCATTGTLTLSPGPGSRAALPGCRTRTCCRRRKHNMIYKLLPGTCALTAVTLLWLLLVFAPARGLDITDDSYYILWAEQPQNVSVSVSAFGFYTGTVLDAAGGGIADFRRLGALILAAAFVLFALTVTRVGAAAAPPHRRGLQRALVFGVVLSGGLAHYSWYWLLSPSYNWLNLLGVLAVGTGLLRWLTRAPQAGLHTAIDGLLVAFGGVLCFAAKPPSAALLGVGVCAIAGGAKPGAVRFVLVCSALAAVGLAIHILVLFPGFADYLALMQEALHRSVMIGTKKSPGETAVLYASEFGVVYGCGLLAAAAVLAAERWWSRAVRALFVLIAAAAAWHLAAEPAARGPEILHFCTAWAVAYPLLGGLMARLGGTVTVAGVADADGRRAARRLWWALFLLPLAYAFGSSNPPMRMMGGASGLTCALLLFSVQASYRGNRQVRLQAAAAAVCLVVIVAMTHAATASPYRLTASMLAQQVPVTLEFRTDELLTDEATAAYINDLQQLARQHGWRRGNMLIDLTGATPGASLILGAQVPGAAWLIGGYAGSQEYIARVLGSQEGAVLATAWLLLAPDGRRRHDPVVLQELGLEFPAGYRRIGTVTTAHRAELQELWQPIQ